mgnify:FL=1
MEEKKTKNIGLIIIVIILLLTCIGMGVFIFINKDKITSQKSNTTTMTNDNKNVEDKKTECTKISYDINTDQYSLSANAVGISVLVDSTRKTARISVNAATISSAFGLSLVATTDTSTYELIGTKFFDKKIVQVLIDGSGQDASSVAILYLMEDGTVEYVPILKDINTNWSQTDNTKKFNSYGKLNGISDIISLVPAEAQGYHTVLARKADGTVINLADTFKATGNFN